MTTLDVFIYTGRTLRTVVVDGEPWFSAADVAAVLELGNMHSSLALLDEDERGLHSVETPGGPQLVSFVNESGLYSLILRSRRPEAREFKRWVTREVLPQIRRTGSYTPTQAVPAVPQTYAEALRAAADAYERAEQAEQQVAQLEQPARAWEGLASGAGDYTVSDAAKILQRGGVDTGPRRLYDYLATEARWVFRRGGRWQAMQVAVAAGWVVERITGGYFDDQTGERKQGDPQVRVTAKGIERLLALMSEQRRLAVVQ
ncbi:phage antirepressor KilAC domain-containing protein [Nocardioides campestrisoli]|uniref:phage antirepressor KilAC domain-containing protein n=1 Tax=Nocardioides campestrisoli TaxID=2736757 RepID=UPI0015E68B07|nr:phage antirepressor KilAC domain-containing protein [Nocardioides campestrisoli]